MPARSRRRPAFPHGWLRTSALSALVALVATAGSAAAEPGRAADLEPAGEPSRSGPAPDRTWDTSRAERGRGHDLESMSTAQSPVHSDVTGDGLADLLAQMDAADAGALRVYAHTGWGESSPWEPEYHSTAARWAFADLVLLADVTGDDRPDVIARDPGVDDGTLWVYPHDGSDGPDPWSAPFAAGTGWNTANGLMVGDVTGDERPDLVARDPSVAGGTMRVYPHNGSATTNPWTTAPIWSGTGWNLATALMLGDATGDDRLDIVARDGDGTLLVYPHNGATASNFWTSIVVGSTGWAASEQLSLGDITGDGLPDVVARDAAGAIWVHPFLSTTPGSMWSPDERTPAGEHFLFATQILLGDLDGDGALDLFARVARGTELQLFPGSGSADGSPWPAAVPAGTDWGFASQVLLGDVDGDGLRDVIALERSLDNGTLWIYPNDGSATGNPWTSRYYAGHGWNTLDMLLVGDVTGDGLDDVVGRDARGNLYAYPSNGSSTRFPWEPRRWAGSGWQTATSLALGDLDGDAIADLVDLESDGSLWVFPTGSSTQPVSIPGTWDDVVSIHLGDITGSGRLDLVARDDQGDLWIQTNGGYAGSNPWTGAPRFGGTGFATALSIAL